MEELIIGIKGGLKIAEERIARGQCPRCGKPLTEQEKKCAIKLCDDCWRYQHIFDEYDDEVEDYEDE